MPEIDRWVMAEVEVNVFERPDERSDQSKVIGHVRAGQHFRVIEETTADGDLWLFTGRVRTMDAGTVAGWLKAKWCRADDAYVDGATLPPHEERVPATDLVTPEELASAVRTLIEYVDQVRAGWQE